MIRKILLGSALALLVFPGCATAQTAGQSVPGYYANAPQTGCTVGPCFIPYGSVLPVSGTFSASLAGFNPTAGATANLTATTSTGSVNLPAGADIVVTNSGANTVHFRLTAGASSAVTTDQTLVAGAAAGFHITTATVLSAITDTSTTTINIQGGAGLVAGYGGGSSGGGGGTSNITQINGVTALAGAGATGTGSLRVTAAQDTTTIAGAAPLTTGVFVTGPSAAALSTAALQTTGNTSLSTIATNSGTQATAANQTTGNSSLGTIATNTTGVATAANQALVQGSKAGGTAATNSELSGGVFNTSAPTLTNGQQAANQLDVNGNLKVNIVTGASSGAVAQGSTTSGQTGGLTQAAATTSAPTYTTGTTNPLNTDLTGALRVNVTSATGVAQGSTTSGQSVSPIGCRTLTSAPTDTTAQTNIPWCKTDGSLAVTVVSGGGTGGTSSSYGAAFPATGTAVGASDGTNMVALKADVNGSLKIAPTASPVGGWTKFNLTAAASTNATNIKASAGALGHISVYNNSATLAWLSFYNTAGTPTCGTSIVYQTMIPANSTSGAGAVEDFAVPLDFSTGIGICVATGIAGTGSVAATSYVINLGFK